MVTTEGLTHARIIEEIRRLRAEQRRAVIPSTADEIGRDIDDLLDASGSGAVKPLGDILDGLGVQADLDDDDLVASAVVVLSVLIPGDNTPRLTIANNEGMSWIEQAGLLRLAERICTEPPEQDE